MIHLISALAFGRHQIKLFLQAPVIRRTMVSIHRPTKRAKEAALMDTEDSGGSGYNPNIVRISVEELQLKADAADDLYEACTSCGRRCEDNRQAGKLGKCNTGMNASVSSHFPHFGEEDCLRGWKGSGTIFFTNCNLKCVYCQNYDVSQEGEGFENNDEEIADKMMELQKRGCHNINFVSPTHVLAPIMRSLVIAKDKGLKLPIVYNTGGYDSMETLTILDGVVDIYMPDMKYSNKKLGRKYSRIENYPEVNQAAVKEMHRQVGDLCFDPETKLAKRGLLVRHLVLPFDQSGSEEIAEYIAKDIGTNTYVNVMAQYRPEHKANNYEKISRQITEDELATAIRHFTDRGVTRLDHRLAQYNRCMYDKMMVLFQKDMDW